MKRRLYKSNVFLASAAGGLLLCGVAILWVASLRIPALEDISERRLDPSVKIYDRTGEILLYDMSADVRRDNIAIEDVSSYAKDAAVAIEDRNLRTQRFSAYFIY